MRKLLPVIVLFLVFSCWPPGLDPDRKDGKFLDEVINLEEFNSEYDDYNSSLPSNRSGESHLIFSSKREKKDVFNLVYFPAFFEYDKHLELRNGEVRPGNDYYQNYVNAGQLIAKANGHFNVYGPSLMSRYYDFNSYSAQKELWLFYADDASGNLDIKCAKTGTPIPSPSNTSIPQPTTLTLPFHGEVIKFTSAPTGMAISTFTKCLSHVPNLKKRRSKAW